MNVENKQDTRSLQKLLITTTSVRKIQIWSPIPVKVQIKWLRAECRYLDSQTEREKIWKKKGPEQW
jgi:hypothetical protein